LTPEQAAGAARACFEFLRPGGYVRAAVPDGHHPDPAYRDAVRTAAGNDPAAEHKVLYTLQTFHDLFTAAGFEVRPLEHHDEGGRFHSVEWDPKEGMIWRSHRFDDGRRRRYEGFTSIIVDAVKPG